MSDPQKEKQAETESTSKTLLSLIGLVFILGALYYGAPRLTEIFNPPANVSEKKDAAELTVAPVVKKSPNDLAAWVPLVEKELAQITSPKCQLRYLRISADASKLLLDLELRKDEKVKQFDLILNRDEFGRYISSNTQIPIKLYPPEGGRAE